MDSTTLIVAPIVFSASPGSREVGARRGFPVIISTPP
jgi:hypothetical protein